MALSQRQEAEAASPYLHATSRALGRITGPLCIVHAAGWLARSKGIEARPLSSSPRPATEKQANSKTALYDGGAMSLGGSVVAKLNGRPTLPWHQAGHGSLWLSRAPRCFLRIRLGGELDRARGLQLIQLQNRVRG